MRTKGSRPEPLLDSRHMVLEQLPDEVRARLQELICDGLIAIVRDGTHGKEKGNDEPEDNR